MLSSKLPSGFEQNIIFINTTDYSLKILIAKLLFKYMFSILHLENDGSCAIYDINVHTNWWLWSLFLGNTLIKMATLTDTVYINNTCNSVSLIN
jgi:hypothetical protein